MPAVPPYAEGIRGNPWRPTRRWQGDSRTLKVLYRSVTSLATAGVGPQAFDAFLQDDGHHDESRHRISPPPSQHGVQYETAEQDRRQVCSRRYASPSMAMRQSSAAPEVTSMGELGIPARLNAVPNGSRTAFRDDPEHHRSVATLATRLRGKAFGFVKRTCPQRSGGT